MEVELNALILAGGISSRMGSDKSLLNIHTKPQWLYLAECCKAAGVKTFISCRYDQEISKQTLFPVIIDKYDSIGPLGGILSAIDYNSNTAWLVIACDLLGLDYNAIQSLILRRDQTKKATVPADFNGSIEPLFSILEPNLYNELLFSYNCGFYSIKAVLEKNEIQIVQLSDSHKFLQNINTPEDLKNFMHSNKISNKKIWKISDDANQLQSDEIAVEEPLEIQVKYGPENSRHVKSISITMRTPGDDADLALGFLYTEGIITKNEEVINVKKPDPWITEDQNNKILVELSYSCEPDIARLERHFYTSSSCGVCGKSSIEALKTIRMPELIPAYPVFDKNLILTLPDILRKSQDVFDQTGGLHASALFDNTGKLVLLKEDVGRHNALDKIAGAGLQTNSLPFKELILLVSGRASFELVQKAAMIGVPVLAAVGAPSSLAVELAEETGITLIGFLRNGRFNIYSHPERVLF